MIGSNFRAGLLARRPATGVKMTCRRGSAASLLTALLLLSSIAPQVTRAQSGDVRQLDQQLVQLYQAGKHAEATALARQILAIREKTLRAEHPDIALTLNRLAILLNAQGGSGEAEALHRRALAIREKTLGANHPDVAQS